MVAVPSFVLMLYDNEMIQLKDEEPWYAAYTIIMILVIVISLFQCGLRGIWIGPLRFVLGTFIGALGAVGWILLREKTTPPRKAVTVTFLTAWGILT